MVGLKVEFFIRGRARATLLHEIRGGRAQLRKPRRVKKTRQSNEAVAEIGFALGGGNRPCGAA